jgi:predicted ester cyclase
MSEASVDLVRRHFEVMWNQRDPSSYSSLMAEDFVEHAAAPFAADAPGRVHGPEAMRGTVEWLTNQFPDLRMEIEAIVADGDLVVARVRARGSNLGRLNGFLPPSGKPFDYAQSHWFRVVDGRLAEHWATRDDLTAMLQLGVVTPPRIGALLRQLRAAARRRLGRARHSRLPTDLAET